MVRVRGWGICVLCCAALAGCRDAPPRSGWSVDDPVDASLEGDVPGAVTPPRTTPAIAGLDLSPGVGDFWQYEISEGRPYALVATVHRLTLTRASTLSVLGAPVRIFDAEWRVIDGSAADQRPSVQLAFAGHRILRRFPDDTPPATRPSWQPEGWPDGWVVIFDAWNGAWPAGDGMFGGFPPGVLIRAESSMWEGRAAWEARAIGGADCQYVPGYGQLCGNDDPNRVFNTSEFFAPGIGLVGATFIGCTSNGCYERRVNLLEWRVSGGPASPPTGTDAGAPRDAQASSPENTNAACSDGVDNDRDGYVDCNDFSCSRNPALTVCPSDGGVPTPSPENTNATCRDGVDNDRDGYVDCNDFDCSRNAAVTVCRG